MKILSRNILVALALGLSSACYAQPAPANDNAAEIQILESIGKDLTAKNYDAARQHYLELIELTPDEAEKDSLRLDRAAINSAAGKDAEAVKEITQVLEKKGVSADIKSAAHVSLANVYRWQKEYAKATAEYRNAATVAGISPDQGWNVRFMSHIMLRSNGDFEGARKELREARAIVDLPAWRVTSADKFIAKSYLREGKYEQAREEFLKVTDIDLPSLSPNDIGVFTSLYQDAQLGIGESYFLEKKYTEAREVYEQILVMSGLDEEARAEARKKLGEIEFLEKQ